MKAKTHNMGICIGYSGRLNTPGQLDTLLRDVRKISANCKWRCTDVDKEVAGLLLRQTGKNTPPEKNPPRLIHERLRGLYVTPPDTETLELVFDTRGRLVCYQQIPTDFITGPIAPDATYFMQFPLWVKTTGALDTHVALVFLLRHLQDRYIRNLKIKDDTGFAKTMDYDRLVREHSAMSFMVHSLQSPEFTRNLLQAGGFPLPPDANLSPLPRRLPIPDDIPKRAAAKVS